MATSIILVCAQGIALAYKRARSSPAKVTRLAPRGFDLDDLVKVLPHVIYQLERADVDLVRSALPTHFAATLARRHVS